MSVPKYVYIHLKVQISALGNADEGTKRFYTFFQGTLNLCLVILDFV